jgi:MFS family permease
LNQPGSSSLWDPLRTPIFRNLLLADVVSDIGTFMQSVGASWLMVSLGAGPLYVALTQTASSLPYFLLAVPAGSAGDIVDRRKLILFTECWMVGVALVLAVLTIAGLITPWLLLGLTFALSAGDAFETPAWRAVLPELVSKDDLAAASALNGIEFNLARAVGPALAGLVISAVGVAAAFVANVLSFAGVIWVIARWKRPVRKRTAPPETLTGATVAAIRYTRNSPAIIALMVRTAGGMFFASSLFALLPSLAKEVSNSAIGYGVLLGCFGAGAVLGALAMQPLRGRWSTEVVVSTGVAILGAAIATSSVLRTLGALSVAIFVGGAAWILFISLVNALIQNLAPDWVRARVLAVFILVSQGAVAFGSAAWGVVAQRAGLHAALLSAGVGAIATTALALFWKLPEATPDLSPWNHWRMPVVVEEVGGELDRGPVLVTVEYLVIKERTSDFLETIHEYERIRRRDGASRWGIFHDTEAADRYLEIFLVGSWAEHERQHERQTRADSELENRLRGFVVKDPEVRHLIFASTTPQAT